jgi:hypothetical protein
MLFAGHSLRSGLANAAAKAGKSERSIMKQTGHRSATMVWRYIRDAELFDQNAAAGIGLEGKAASRSPALPIASGHRWTVSTSLAQARRPSETSKYRAGRRAGRVRDRASRPLRAHEPRQCARASPRFVQVTAEAR